MGHPDFRVNGKIFATLAWPDRSWAMVKLTLDDQQFFVHAHPEMFQPVKGGWGRQGATNVLLSAARTSQIRSALRAAWRNAAPKRLTGEYNDDDDA